MMCLLVAIVNWHKSLQFVKKSNIAVLPCLFIILLAVSMITLIKLYHVLARFQIRKMKLILFCRVLTSSRHQKIFMILQIAPLIDQISVLGEVVVPIVDVECQKKCPAIVKVGLSRFQQLIGELASVYHRQYSRCVENSYNLAPVSRLLTTVCKITRNYARGGKGHFRTSYSTLTKVVSLHQKSHQNFSLPNFKYAARISTPVGPLHISERGCAPGISKTTAIKL